jgi:hypothetical protein
MFFSMFAASCRYSAKEKMRNRSKRKNKKRDEIKGKREIKIADHSKREYTFIEDTFTLSRFM